MRRNALIFCAACLLILAAADAQAPPGKKTPPQAQGPLPVDQFAEDLARRLGSNLQVKTIVGEPIKAGRVTLIPILMLDIGFGGGGGGAPQDPGLGGRGFYMSGEVRPLGFVAVSKAGTKFISVGKIPRK